MEVMHECWLFSGEDSQEGDHVPNISLNASITFTKMENKTSIVSGILGDITLPPPPPAYFLGYTLPPGHPCNSFTLPPPPADKKRTGPRRKFPLLPSQQKMFSLLLLAFCFLGSIVNAASHSYTCAIVM